MIDVENQIYTPIAAALREKFPGISVSGEYVKGPSKVPVCEYCRTGQLHDGQPAGQQRPGTVCNDPVRSKRLFGQGRCKEIYLSGNPSLH